MSIDLDISFFEKLFKNDRSKIEKTLLAYTKEIPFQLENLKTSLDDHEFENMKLVSHSMKSTFKYIGRNDLSKTAKEIEELATTNNSADAIKEKVKHLVSNWKLLETAIKKQIEQ